MANQETHGFDAEMVHRYFDGDLDAGERREAEALLERSAEARSMLTALERQSALLRETAESWAGGLTAHASDDLFARIEAALPADARAGAARAGDAAPPSAAPTSPAKPALRAIPGGRRRAVFAAVTVALAAAAAVLFAVRQPDVPGATRPGPEAPVAQVRGSEVIAVDFGRNAGTLFNVEGQAGEALAVVWISDQVEKP